MKRQDVWAFARRWTWLLLAGTLLTAALSYAISSNLPRVYEAKTKLLVAPGQVDGRSTDYNALQGASLLTHTYADLLKTRDMLDKAGQASGLDPSTMSVDAVQQRDTQILEITVHTGDPDAAAVFANALASVFVADQRAMQEGRFTSSEDRLTEQANQLNATISNRNGSLEALRTQPQSVDRDTQIARLQGELASLQQSLTTATRSLDDLRLTAARTSDVVSVADQARPSPTPIAPRVMVNVLLAALAGLLASGGVAYVLQRIDNRVLTPQRLTELTGLSPLGTVAPLSAGTIWALERSGKTGSQDDYKTAQVAEEFRLLWTYMRFMDEQRPLEIVLVTSSTAGEGKTSTAANLALVAARAGQRMLVVDADLRRPTVHEIFNTPNRVGLTTLLLQEGLPASAAVEATGVPGLAVLPSGPMSPSPSALLASMQMSERMAELRGLADLIIVDSPPTLAVSDSAVLAGLADGTLLVADAQTRASEVTNSIEILEQAGAQMLGVVLNRVRSHRPEYYASYQSDVTDDAVRPTRAIQMRPNPQPHAIVDVGTRIDE